MNVLQLFKPVTTFIFDLDGVLTDGTVLVLENGLQARRMHIKDGFALQLAIKQGYTIKVISGSIAQPAAERLKQLGVTDVHMGVQDKMKMVADHIEMHQLKKEQVLFMGDDLPDLAAMTLAGLPCCPNDAVHEIKEISLYISPRNGGDACARDVIEKVLKLNGHWQATEGVTSA